jgi:hypothetical protein
MSAYDQLIEHLPTLWRPQPRDATLLAQWLAAVGSALDGAGADIQHVLRAHWFDTADAAAWAKHFGADRRERGLGVLRPNSVPDQREAQRYPHVRDLARLAALLDLPPWRDPASQREEVEEFRQRVHDVLGAYRAGLTPPVALRKLIDAALPEDMTVPLAAQRAMYALEEPVALRSQTTPLVATPAVQEGARVAPLSRWAVAGPGVPEFVVQGVAADAIGAATLNPMLELYTPSASVKGIGVAYAGTLAEGQALRLAAGRRHWLLRGAALLGSAAETAANAARDPSANGPYTEAATLAAGTAVAASAAADGAIWLLQRGAGADSVQRFDGSATPVVVDTDAPAGPYHALCCAGEAAWLGTDAGLFRCPLWPTDNQLRWSAVAGVAGAVRAITAVAHAGSEGVLAAGAQGLWQLGPDASVVAQRHATLDLVGFASDTTQELLATANALFLARQGQVWRYDAPSVSEQIADWVETAAPANDQTSPLPPITTLALTRDGSLWLAGAAGLARWFAGDDGVTRLAAFPDLLPGAVHGLEVDDRGMLWIAAANGLLRFDGRDMAQFDFANSVWLPLGDADLTYPEELRSEPRGFWLFDRAAGVWQRFDARTRRFADPALPLRATAAEAVNATLMRPALRAELGSFDGGQFVASGDVPAGELHLRIKPDETRTVDGVLPYLPANVVANGGTWRYLQMAPAATPPDAQRPWWSSEGQLFEPPLRSAAVPGHRRDLPAFLADAQHEGQFDHSAFVYPPSAKLTLVQAAAPIGIRVRLFVADPQQGIDPAIAERVWQLIARARPAGVPLQLMAEGTVLKESSS